MKEKEKKKKKRTEKKEPIPGFEPSIFSFVDSLNHWPAFVVGFSVLFP